MKFTDRFKTAWNVFRNRNPSYTDPGQGYYYRPDSGRLTGGKERSIVNSILNRIAVDAASVKINHVKVDENGRFLEIVNSGLNTCLNVEANIDQTGRAFIQDAILTMLDKGCVVLLPVNTVTDLNKADPTAKDIRSIRVGTVVQWYPRHVRVEAWNEDKGRKEQVVVPKTECAIIENPFYSVMNAPNSMMHRLSHKLALLDAVDDKNNSGKLDLIIKLPYATHSEIKIEQARKRIKTLEEQLNGSKYGVAYVDATEGITQLNRPIENNLMKQIEFLTNTVMSQLGFTMEILDGSANESTMTNYYARIIEPILAAGIDEMIRTFLTPTARAQHNTIMYFNDPFRLIPITKVAEIGDKMKRNEILSSNELRQILGYKPDTTDPNADKLVNSNIRQDPKALAGGQPNPEHDGPEKEETNK